MENNAPKTQQKRTYCEFIPSKRTGTKVTSQDPNTKVRVSRTIYDDPKCVLTTEESKNNTEHCSVSTGDKWIRFDRGDTDDKARRINPCITKDEELFENNNFGDAVYPGEGNWVIDPTAPQNFKFRNPITNIWSYPAPAAAAQAPPASAPASPPAEAPASPPAEAQAPTASPPASQPASPPAEAQAEEEPTAVEAPLNTVKLVGVVYNPKDITTDFTYYVNRPDILIVYNENFKQYLDKKDCSVGSGNGVMRQYRSDKSNDETVTYCIPSKAIVLGIPTGETNINRQLFGIHGLDTKLNATTNFTLKNVIDEAIDNVYNKAVDTKGIRYVLWSIKLDGTIGAGVFNDNDVAKKAMPYITLKLKEKFGASNLGYYPLSSIVTDHGNPIDINPSDAFAVEADAPYPSEKPQDGNQGKISNDPNDLLTYNENIKYLINNLTDQIGHIDRIKEQLKTQKGTVQQELNSMQEKIVQLTNLIEKLKSECTKKSEQPPLPSPSGGTGPSPSGPGQNTLDLKELIKRLQEQLRELQTRFDSLVIQFDTLRKRLQDCEKNNNTAELNEQLQRVIDIKLKLDQQILELDHQHVDDINSIYASIDSFKDEYNARVQKINNIATDCDDFDKLAEFSPSQRTLLQRRPNDSIPLEAKYVTASLHKAPHNPTKRPNELYTPAVNPTGSVVVPTGSVVPTVVVPTGTSPAVSPPGTSRVVNTAELKNVNASVHTAQSDLAVDGPLVSPYPSNDDPVSVRRPKDNPLISESLEEHKQWADAEVTGGNNIEWTSIPDLKIKRFQFDKILTELAKVLYGQQSDYKCSEVMYNTLVTQFRNLKEETTDVMVAPTNKSLGSRQVTKEQYPILIRTLFKLAVDKLGSENIVELNRQITPETIPSNIDIDNTKYDDDSVCRWLSFLIVAYVSFSKDFGWCPVEMPFRCKTDPEYCVTDPELCKDVKGNYDVQENPGKYSESPLGTTLSNLFKRKSIRLQKVNTQNNKPDDKWLFFKPPPKETSDQKKVEDILGMGGIAGSDDRGSETLADIDTDVDSDEIQTSDQNNLEDILGQKTVEPLKQDSDSNKNENSNLGTDNSWGGTA